MNYLTHKEVLKLVDIIFFCAARKWPALEINNGVITLRLRGLFKKNSLTTKGIQARDQLFHTLETADISVTHTEYTIHRSQYGKACVDGFKINTNLFDFMLQNR